ncbi:hypothetical protein HBB16_00515 [Pseudonocardia sp. MCCB 268]|nr:hypothetical protein [Pseudonocardia cytotoxica]
MSLDDDPDRIGRARRLLVALDFDGVLGAAGGHDSATSRLGSRVGRTRSAGSSRAPRDHGRDGVRRGRDDLATGCLGFVPPVGAGRQPRCRA